MKFDYVIGNPPYQEERRGDSTTALPIYHDFMTAAYNVGKAVELITPARFLFNAGRTPKAWNEQMLNDIHLKVMSYEHDGSQVFPNTEIKGGVAVTYRDESKQYNPVEVFTVYPELNDILAKVKGHFARSIGDVAFVASKFNVDTLFEDYPKYIGHERRMSSNVLSFDCFNDKQETNCVMIYGVLSSKRTQRFIQIRYVDMSDEHIGGFKIVTPKADGNGTFGDTLTNPEILPPMSGFTHTFLGIGSFSTQGEAENALKYIKSKFARTLLGVLKITQDLNADKFRYVPLQDFTPSSDIDWSKSISEIDQQLYKKYGLSPEEIDFIETHVKEMK